MNAFSSLKSKHSNNNFFKNEHRVDKLVPRCCTAVIIEISYIHRLGWIDSTDIHTGVSHINLK